MELRVLTYFLMVAREENITKAANLLHVTQPTLSRQLMQLEEELGVKLFERSSHKIMLTEEGMLLKRRAQELVSLAEKTKQELSDKGQLSGDIAIGCGEIHSMGCFSEFLVSFRDKYPLIHYEIYSGNADNIKDRIERGLLDLGLLLEPVDIGKYGFIRMPQKEQWGVLVRKDSPLAHKKEIHPEDLVGIPLLSTKRELVQNELSNWFGEYADQIEVAASYNLIYNAAIMAEKNAGALLCIKLESKFDSLCFVPFSPQLELGSVLAWKKHQIFSKTTSAFLDHAKEYFNRNA